MFKAGDQVVRSIETSYWVAKGGKMGCVYTVLKSDGDGLELSLMPGIIFSEDYFILHVPDATKQGTPEYTGGSVDYYKVEVKNPTTADEPYMAECNDIIEALGMNYAEGNAFKALWRRAAHRTLGKKKAGAKDDGLYDAEKVAFFGKRLVEQSKVTK